MPRPIPDPAPVTTAVFPFSSTMILPVLGRRMASGVMIVPGTAHRQHRGSSLGDRFISPILIAKA
jgi:hypothetical protein